MKPVALELHLIYACTKCSHRHRTTIDYAKKISKILCKCGDVLVLDAIHKFDIKTLYVDDIAKKEKLQHNVSRTPQEQSPTAWEMRRRELKEMQEKDKKSHETRESFFIDVETSDTPLIDTEQINIDTTSKTNKRKEKLRPLSRDHENKCVSLLESLGWKRRESKNKILTMVSDWLHQGNKSIDDSNFDDFLQYVVRNQK